MEKKEEFIRHVKRARRSVATDQQRVGAPAAPRCPASPVLTHEEEEEFSRRHQNGRHRHLLMMLDEKNGRHRRLLLFARVLMGRQLTLTMPVHIGMLSASEPPARRGARDQGVLLGRISCIYAARFSFVQMRCASIECDSVLCGCLHFCGSAPS